MSKRHIQSLIRRREELQTKIDAELASAHPHWPRLARLKKLRLHLKDRLTRLMAETSRVVEGPRLATAAERRRRMRVSSPPTQPGAH
jgi:uncharacterized protein YdcH (DUF465 family)